MKIVFLHGLKSSPHSFKRRFLEEQGHIVYAPPLPPDDWETSVLRTQELIQTVKPDVVIGSSRGGAVAIASRAVCDLILIAPAWKKYCPWGTIPAKAQIIHSPNDEVVDFDDSVELAHTFGAMLIEAGEDHRMNDTEAAEALLDALAEIS